MDARRLTTAEWTREARLLAAALLLVLSACASDAPISRLDGLSEAIGEQVRRGPGTRFCLGELTGSALKPPAAWDRVSIFGPYTSPEQVREVLGTDWYGDDARAIRRDDLWDLLVFQSGGRVVAAGLHPRGSGDFDTASVGRYHTVERACFVVNPPADDWYTLRPG
jgi:hypothetical protein